MSTLTVHIIELDDYLNRELVQYSSVAVGLLGDPPVPVELRFGEYPIKRWLSFEPLSPDANEAEVRLWLDREAALVIKALLEPDDLT